MNYCQDCCKSSHYIFKGEGKLEIYKDIKYTDYAAYKPLKKKKRKKLRCDYYYLGKEMSAETSPDMKSVRLTDKYQKLTQMTKFLPIFSIELIFYYDK